MIENLQDELYQLENKQTKTFLTMLQDFLQSTWKTEYAKSNNIWVTSTDDINQDILAVLRTFLNLQEKIYGKLYTKDTTSKAATTNGLKEVFYKHFSNELAPVLLNVYDSWGKLGTMDITSRTGIILPCIKKVIKEIYQTLKQIYRTMSSLNLEYKFYTTILKIWTKKH